MNDDCVVEGSSLGGLKVLCDVRKASVFLTDHDIARRQAIKANLEIGLDVSRPTNLMTRPSAFEQEPALLGKDEALPSEKLSRVVSSILGLSLQ